jgi:hypothetical protein
MQWTPVEVAEARPSIDLDVVASLTAHVLHQLRHPPWLLLHEVAGSRVRLRAPKGTEPLREAHI